MWVGLNGSIYQSRFFVFAFECEASDVANLFLADISYKLTTKLAREYLAVCIGLSVRCLLVNMKN